MFRSLQGTRGAIAVVFGLLLVVEATFASAATKGICVYQPYDKLVKAAPADKTKIEFVSAAEHLSTPLVERFQEAFTSYGTKAEGSDFVAMLSLETADETSFMMLAVVCLAEGIQENICRNRNYFILGEELGSEEYIKIYQDTLSNGLSYREC